MYNVGYIASRDYMRVFHATMKSVTSFMTVSAVATVREK